MLKQVTIIGMGLIGGSVAHALKQHQLCQTIVGFDNNQQALQTAEQLNLVDGASLDLATAVANSELIFIAIPVSKTETLLSRLADHIGKDTIVTDVGSTKHTIIKAAQKALGEKFINFVPAHPVAGSHLAGVDNHIADLFANRNLIITPTTDTNPQAIATVKAIWEQFGSKIVTMDSIKHDNIFANTSHFPHLLAFAFMNTIAAETNSNEILTNAGSGFKDFTRIAGADVDMWTDILLANSVNILELTQRYQQWLLDYSKAIETNDKAQLTKLIKQASDLQHELGTHQ